MAKYVVQWWYKSSLGGPWQKGEVVELGEAQAAMFNADSPGVLEPAAEVLSLPGKERKRRVVTQAQERVEEKKAGQGEFVMGAGKAGYGAELLKDEE